MTDHIKFNNDEQIDDELDIIDDSMVDDIIDTADNDDYGVGELRDRFEQFKLYELLMNHKLFSPGSVDPRIAIFVEREVKTFIASRMKVLMGREPDSSAPRQSLNNVFTSDQVEALKSIADRLVQKGHQPMPSREPQLNPAQGSNVGHGENAGAALSKQVAPVIGSRPTVNTTRRKKRAIEVRTPSSEEIPIGEYRLPTPEEGNMGSDGTIYAQVAPPLRGRIPPPTAEQANAIYAMEAEKNARAFQGSPAGSGGSVLNTAILLSQKKNANVPE